MGLIAENALRLPQKLLPNSLADLHYRAPFILLATVCKLVFLSVESAGQGTHSFVEDAMALAPYWLLGLLALGWISPAAMAQGQ